MDSYKTPGEKAKWEQYRNAMSCFEQLLEAATNKIATVGHLPPITQNIQDELDLLGTTGEVKADDLAMFSSGLLHIDTLMLTNQQKLTFISSVRALDVI